MSHDNITIIPNLAQIKYISVLPIRPFFEIYISPNLIWDKFGITVMSSGLILITGSNSDDLRLKYLGHVIPKKHGFYKILWIQPWEYWLHTNYDSYLICLS